MALSTYSCFCFTRKFKNGEIQPVEDVRAAFEAYADGVGSGGGSTMSSEGFRRFLMDQQGEKGISLAEAGKLMDRVHAEKEVGGATKHLIGRIVKASSSVFFTIDDFYHFLFLDDVNPPINQAVHQDMSAPLSHYYIFTGHNSYLTGNQLSSDSSDKPIIKALLRGVRVIELDMWPNSTKDNVEILHGRTLCSPVGMLTCLQSIKKYAFEASPYPLIITLEDHLTPDLQTKVAHMIKETFGDLLFVPTDEPMKEFPSPNELQKRIIISTKPPKEYLESKDMSRNESQNIGKKVSNTKESQTGDTSMKDSNKVESNLKSLLKQEEEYEREASDSKSEDESEDEEEEEPKLQKNTSNNQYKNLITIQAGKPKGHTKDALKVDPDKVRRLSLSEQKLAKATTNHCADLIRFTQRNIVRVFPKGTRVRSTNYKPILAWTHGAQMVAFNMQGYGKQLNLMQGFFKANGGCGYVKKPDFLMKTGPNGEVFDPNATLHIKQTLKVKVYTGNGWSADFSKKHFDTYSPPDFYTKIAIDGVPADSQKKKTKVREDDWVPVWDEEFSFPLTVPELAILRIEVKDYDMSEKHDFAGQACLPVSELRPGIRSVPLYDKKGKKYNSVRLLMRFKFVSNVER
ncbi:hypothetical protein LUZ60_015363 [Juncus effusus]|nr:hypothetical protein LUZ60_015363 [Juncus effusus]